MIQVRTLSISWCFNSILVRLKGVHGGRRCCRTALFQFHSGTVKSTEGAEIGSIGTRFNSILVRLKAPGNVVSGCLVIRFNSILVRLKVAMVASQLQGRYEFQFHSGTVKRTSPGFNYPPLRVSIPFWYG